jgi:hypothetical protein
VVKSPAMEAFLEDMAMSTYGRSRKHCLENHICVVCGGPAVEFEDMLSRREFYISAICQKCQDETFSED